MSHRFVRCAHCGLPHDVNEVRCPSTGLPIKPGRYSAFPQAPTNAVRPSPEIMRAPRVPRFDAPGPQRPASPPSQPRARITPAPPPNAGATLTAAEAAQGSWVGRIIGDKYGVTAVIGEGGMGAVYEAEHLAIGRLVALKVLHPTNAKRQDAVQRFHHEARVAGSIGHPNICEIYDVGKLEDGSPYLVMERLHGETLADRIAREGALPFMDVIDILLQVLSALIAAHAKGVVHRDIKPENIFLCDRTTVAGVGGAASKVPIAKLLDFGISKVGDELDLHLTRTGMVMGTPYYMAPEQARGDRTIDHRVDLYATGVILYESLTGRRPFLAPNYNALLVQILSGTPRPMRELRPALPIGFDPIVEKALSKSRERRFQNANEFLEALTKLRDELSRHPDPAEIAREVEKLRDSVRPAPRRPESIAPPSVEIPVHFSPGTGSGQYATVNSGELLAADIGDTAPGSEPQTSARTSFDDHPTVEDVPPIPRRAPVEDTFVESRPSPFDEFSDRTEVMPPPRAPSPPRVGVPSRPTPPANVPAQKAATPKIAPQKPAPPRIAAPPAPRDSGGAFADGNTPVHGIELAAVRRQLRGGPPPDATTKSAPLDAAEAEEIVRAARRKVEAKPLAKNPLAPPKPAMRAQRVDRTIPREEPDATIASPRPPMQSRPVDDDDAPTTFFRPKRPMPSVPELSDDDEIPETGGVHRTEPAPPPRISDRPLPKTPKR